MGRNIRNFYLYPNCREIDLNGLVGYIGGYIGLFLGYSILQIPDLILLVSAIIKKYFRKSAVDVTRSLSQPTKIHVKEVASNNIGLETTTRNAKLGGEHTLCLLQTELKQILGNMNERSQEMREESKVLKGK
jgi:hypothetical protein